MAILDWVKELPLAAIYKERLVDSEKQIAALEQKVVDLSGKVVNLEHEKVKLQARLEESEQNRRALEEQVKKKVAESHSSNPDGYICDHCASSNLRRTGSRPDPTFGPLGIKQKVFCCEACGKESAFTPDAR